MNIEPADKARYGVKVPVLIIGAGAGGLTAALSAHDAGADVVVLERDETPFGSTSMSSGFIPAPATRLQKSRGIEDSPGRFYRDIRAKAHGRNDARLARLAAHTIGPALDWLESRYGLEWVLLDAPLYPGHSVHRMHTMHEKTGAALLAGLLNAAGAAGIPVMTNACAEALFVNGDRIEGVRVTRAGANHEDIACTTVILACGGFAANRALVREHIPTMANAPYYGHEGNEGHALLWGQALGGAAQHLGGFQGHGSLAIPHNILITWALMMDGGIQINAHGERFANEHLGYSEQAEQVLRQPGEIAWCVFDERLLHLAKGFPDFALAVTAGAIRSAGGLKELARLIAVPHDNLVRTFACMSDVAAGKCADPFARAFTPQTLLCAPYHAIKVTGALFHTQGGLLIDDAARVMGSGGDSLPNLLAAGGAACGVSGPDSAGYLSGNGLLSAIAFGRLAGLTAAGALNGKK